MAFSANGAISQLSSSCSLSFLENYIRDSMFRNDIDASSQSYWLRSVDVQSESG